MRTSAPALFVLALLAAPVGAQLDADFGVDATTGTNPATFQFTDLTTGGTPLVWIWQFGDGTTSNLPDPGHVYTAPGTYTVSLAVQAAGFQLDIETKVGLITVEPALLVPAFDLDVTAGEQPLTVQFTDLSQGAVTGWLWDFGDGSVSGQQHPSHTYQVAATTAFDVTLTVFLQGQAASLLVEDAVVVGPATLTPGFSASPSVLFTGETVQLVDATTSSGPDPALAWGLSPAATLVLAGEAPTYLPHVDQPTRHAVTLTASLGPQQAVLTQPAAFGVVPAPFAPTATFSGWPDDVRRLVLADLDVDGHLDALAASRRQVAWCAGDGTGGFRGARLLATQLTTTPGLAVGDLTGDGAPEVVLYDDVLLAQALVNDGQGGFGAPVGLPLLSGRTFDVAVLDVDADGDLDLAAAQGPLDGGFDHRVLVLVNTDGAGAFGVGAQNTAVDTSRLGVFDGDGDGDPDLLVDQGWLRNQHPGWVHHANVWDLGGFAVGDLDGDGDLDAFGEHDGWDEFQWVENRGQPELTLHPVWQLTAGFVHGQRPVLADLDQDGDLDAAGLSSPVVGWGWLQQPADSATPWPVRSAGPQSHVHVGVADLDGDGDVDLVHDQGFGTAGDLLGVRRGLWTSDAWPQTGPALASPSGRPGLVGHGSLSGGALFGLTVDQGRPGGAAYLIVGTATLDAPFKGGVLGPVPTLILPVGAVRTDGLLPLLFDGPVGLPVGVDIWLQAWIQDPGLPAGYSATRTLRTTTL